MTDDTEAVRNRQYVALLRNQLTAYRTVVEDLEFTLGVPGLPGEYTRDVKIALAVCASMASRTAEEIALREGASQEPIH